MEQKDHIIDFTPRFGDHCRTRIFMLPETGEKRWKQLHLRRDSLTKKYHWELLTLQYKDGDEKAIAVANLSFKPQSLREAITDMKRFDAGHAHGPMRTDENIQDLGDLHFEGFLRLEGVRQAKDGALIFPINGRPVGEGVTQFIDPDEPPPLPKPRPATPIDPTGIIEQFYARPVEKASTKLLRENYELFRRDHENLPWEFDKVAKDATRPDLGFINWCLAKDRFDLLEKFHEFYPDSLTDFRDGLGYPAHHRVRADYLSFVMHLRGEDQLDFGKIKRTMFSPMARQTSSAQENWDLLNFVIKMRPDMVNFYDYRIFLKHHDLPENLEPIRALLDMGAHSFAYDRQVLNKAIAQDRTDAFDLAFGYMSDDMRNITIQPALEEIATHDAINVLIRMEERGFAQDLTPQDLAPQDMTRLVGIAQLAGSDRVAAHLIRDGRYGLDQRDVAERLTAMLEGRLEHSIDAMWCRSDLAPYLTAPGWGRKFLYAAIKWDRPDWVQKLGDAGVDMISPFTAGRVGPGHDGLSPLELAAQLSGDDVLYDLQTHYDRKDEVQAARVKRASRIYRVRRPYLSDRWDNMAFSAPKITSEDTEEFPTIGGIFRPKTAAFAKSGVYQKGSQRFWAEAIWDRTKGHWRLTHHHHDTVRNSHQVEIETPLLYADLALGQLSGFGEKAIDKGWQLCEQSTQHPSYYKNFLKSEGLMSDQGNYPAKPPVLLNHRPQARYYIRSRSDYYGPIYSHDWETLEHFYDQWHNGHYNKQGIPKTLHKLITDLETHNDRFKRLRYNHFVEACIADNRGALYGHLIDAGTFDDDQCRLFCTLAAKYGQADVLISIVKSYEAPRALWDDVLKDVYQIALDHAQYQILSAVSDIRPDLIETCDDINIPDDLLGDTRLDQTYAESFFVADKPIKVQQELLEKAAFFAVSDSMIDSQRYKVFFLEQACEQGVDIFAHLFTESGDGLIQQAALSDNGQVLDKLLSYPVPASVRGSQVAKLIMHQLEKGKEENAIALLTSDYGKLCHFAHRKEMLHTALEHDRPSFLNALTAQDEYKPMLKKYLLDTGLALKSTAQAIEKGQHSLLIFLRDCGVDMAKPYGDAFAPASQLTPLLHALHNCDKKAVLILRDADPNHSVPVGNARSPNGIASLRHNEKSQRALLGGIYEPDNPSLTVLETPKAAPWIMAWRNYNAWASRRNDIAGLSVSVMRGDVPNSFFDQINLQYYFDYLMREGKDDILSAWGEYNLGLANFDDILHLHAVRDDVSMICYLHATDNANAIDWPLLVKQACMTGGTSVLHCIAELNPKAFDCLDADYFAENKVRLNLRIDDKSDKLAKVLDAQTNLGVRRLMADQILKKAITADCYDAVDIALANGASIHINGLKWIDLCMKSGDTKTLGRLLDLGCGQDAPPDKRLAYIADKCTNKTLSHLHDKSISMLIGSDFSAGASVDQLRQIQDSIGPAYIFTAQRLSDKFEARIPLEDRLWRTSGKNGQTFSP